jgi:hypothetical protein
MKYLSPQLTNLIIGKYAQKVEFHNSMVKMDMAARMGLIFMLRPKNENQKQTMIGYMALQ